MESSQSTSVADRSPRPPRKRGHHDLAHLFRQAHRRVQRSLHRPSLRAELAWSHMVHAAMLVRKPLQSRNVWLFVGAVLAATVATVYAREMAMPQESAYMAGIFVLAALLWVTEAVPLFATALVIIGLEIVLLANPGSWGGLGFEQGPSPDYREFMAAAADPIIILFFGGFVLARAAVREGVDRALAGVILRLFRGRPLYVMLGLMVVTALFSMWMSNTASTAMMITLIAPMLAQIPEKDRLRKALVLSVPFAANIGGMMTPISSPPNAVAVGFLTSAGYEVTFLQWMLIAVPLASGLLIVAWLMLWLLFAPSTPDLHLESSHHTVDARGLFVLGVFVVTVLLWLTDRVHGLPTAVVALVPAIAFTATGLLDRNDINSLEWNVLILIAGGIALGTGMQRTGLDDIIIQYMPTQGTFVLIGLVTGTVLVSTFMSNTAAANLILPVAVSLALVPAAAGGPSAIHLALSIALAASMSMALPVSTPPNAIAYASGELTARDFALAGGILGVLAVILICAFGGPIIQFWMAAG